MAKNRYTLTDWCLTQHPDDAYTAPECRGNPSLGGLVNGRKVVTSPIKEVRGRTVITQSGSVYRLEGEPNEFFTKFVADKKLRVLKSAPLRPLVEAKFIHLA